MPKAGKAAIIAGGLAAITIGAIALSSRSASAAPAGAPPGGGGGGEPPPGGTTPVKGSIEAPTTGEIELVREGVEGMLAAIPDATLDQYVLGSLDNLVSLIAAEGPEGAYAVYEPDDVAAIYQSSHLIGTGEDRDLADNMMIDMGIPAAEGTSDIPSGVSLWLDQADYFDGEGRLAPVIAAFIARQQTGIA